VRGAFLIAAAGGAALVATAAPLPVYAATLVLFGFAHVVVELRYVRDRFGRRIDGRLAATWFALLGGLALVRAADYAHVPIPGGRTWVELALLAALFVATALATRGTRRWIALLATGAFAALVAFVSPGVAIVALAFLHNLTPLGFLAEALRDPRLSADPALRRTRRRDFALALVAFLVVPALIVSGAAGALLASLHLSSLDGAFLGIGRAADHYSVFVPAPWRERDLAPRLFAAAVYLQCAHYFVVLHVLPRLARTEPATAAAALSRSTPARASFMGAGGAVRVGIALAVAAGAILVLAFLRDFADGRALYGIAASVHAWVEWPLFLGLLLGAVR
jgi:hypothetical protein